MQRLLALAGSRAAIPLAPLIIDVTARLPGAAFDLATFGARQIV